MFPFVYCFVSELHAVNVNWFMLVYRYYTTTTTYTYTTHYTHACVCLNCISLLVLVRILLLYVDLCYIQVYGIAKHIYYIHTSILVR